MKYCNIAVIRMISDTRFVHVVLLMVTRALVINIMCKCNVSNNLVKSCPCSMYMYYVFFNYDLPEYLWTGLLTRTVSVIVSFDQFVDCYHDRLYCWCACEMTINDYASIHKPD